MARTCQWFWCKRAKRLPVAQTSIIGGAQSLLSVRDESLSTVAIRAHLTGVKSSLFALRKSVAESRDSPFLRRASAVLQRSRYKE